MPLVDSFFAVAAPGKSSDQAAIERTSLPASLDGLPLGSYVVGDAAYTLSDKCITPSLAHNGCILQRMHITIF